jgi:hypothetical protein
MKVIRVTNKYHKNTLMPIIEVGERVSVTEQKASNYTGEIMFHIAEYPSAIINGEPHKLWYDAKGFATLPTEDQEKEIECENEAIIYQR